MSMTQLKLFSSVEMKAMRVEKQKIPKKIKLDLTKRFVPDFEDVGKYNFFLEKEDLIRDCKNYNEEVRQAYEKGDLHYFGYRAAIMNPGVPQMLLTTLSQFSNKKQEDLFVLDLVVLYHSIGLNFPDQKIEYSNLKKFRKANKLSFFGGSQYFLMGRNLKRSIF